MFEMLMMILSRLETSGDCILEIEGNHFDVTLCDFEGFDSNWSEVMREYEDEEMVEALFEVLDRAERTEGNYYVTYYFDDCSLELGYTSMDI